MPDEQHESVELRTYVRIVRRRRGWIVIGIVIGIVIAVARAQGSPRYKATALILLQARGIDAAGVTNGQAVSRQASGGTGYVGDLYQSTIVLQSKVMRDRVEKRLGYPSFVTAAFIPFTDLIRITAETPTPKVSADIANAFASEYRDFRREQTEQVYNEAINGLNVAVGSLRRQADLLQGELAKLPETSPQRASLALLRATYLDNVQSFESRASALQVNSGLFAGSVQLVEPATVPISSTEPSRREQLKNGLLVGVVLAGLFVAIVEFFDRRLTEVSSVQRSTGQPILARIPRVLRWRLSTRPHLGGRSRSAAAAIEAYRGLRSALTGRPHEPGATTQVFVFNALRPGSGTSTTVLNLAHLFAAGGRSTLLLDLDAHRRAASTFSGQTPAMPGFAELVGGAELGIGLLTVGREGLLVMGPGQMAKEPAEFLAEPRVTAAIGRLRAEFEVILIDSPALQIRNDALSFCAVADAVVLVCRLGRVTEEELDDFFLAHQRAGAVIAGTIVTSVRESRVTRTRMILSRRRSRSTLVQARLPAA